MRVRPSTIHRVVFAGFLLTCVAVVGRAEGVSPGQPIDDFTLSDVYGQDRKLTDYGDRKAVVLAFLGTECPLARLYAPRLVALAKKYESAGVTFLGVSSNMQDNVTELRHFAREHGIDFPILKDVGNVLADRLGVERLPIVFVLDERHVVRYRGRIDDQYGLQATPAGKRVSYQLPSARRQDLAIALDELLAGKPVGVASTDPSGCLVGRKKESDPTSEVTYSKHIAGLFNQHCVFCHREGQIAPFALTSYDDAAGWAEMIQEVVQEQRMPPWHADPRYGHFVNDARLTQDEKDLIAKWVAAGAPEGNKSDLPARPQFTDGWMIPKPDQIIYMPQEFQVPAEGTVDYQSFVVDPGWTEDKWVTAMEPRPGNPAVVHHIVMYVMPPPGVSKYYSADLPKTQLDWFASFAPGLRPPVLPAGTARFIPAGSKLVFQMHYTPNGKAQSDRSYLGIKFADPKSVKQEVAVQHAGSHDFRIPPHADNHQVDSWYTFEHESLLWSVSPHMHLRGKDFRYTLVYPDGKEEIVLDVPQYDFGWQTTYILAEPKRVPKGAKLHCVAHFDNSTNNLNNPDPSVEVSYGPQTWEEMCYGWFEICLADQNIAAELAKGPRDPRERTKQFLAAAPAADAMIPESIQSAAKTANGGGAQFQKFADALGSVLPQVDRVCILTLDDDYLRLRQVGELNKVRTPFRANSTRVKASESVLAEYILAQGQPMAHADLNASDDPLFKRMAGRGVKSSFHVPLVIDGVKCVVSFWSTEPDAFPPAAQTFLAKVAPLLKTQ